MLLEFQKLGSNWPITLDGSVLFQLTRLTRLGLLGTKLEISIGQSPSYIEQLTGQTNNFQISPHRLQGELEGGRNRFLKSGTIIYE